LRSRRQVVLTVVFAVWAAFTVAINPNNSYAISVTKDRMATLNECLNE
jgi:hypothetical protein